MTSVMPPRLTPRILSLALFTILFLIISRTNAWIITDNQKTQFTIKTSTTSADENVRKLFLVPGQRLLSFFGSVCSQQTRCTIGDGAHTPSLWYWELNISTAYSSYDLIPVARWLLDPTTEQYHREVFDPNNYGNTNDVPFVRFIAPSSDPNFANPILKLSCTSTNSVIYDTGLTIHFYGFTQKLLESSERDYPSEEFENCNGDPSLPNIYCRRYYPLDHGGTVIQALYSTPSANGAYLSETRALFWVQSASYMVQDDAGTREEDFPYTSNQLMFGTTLTLVAQKFNGVAWTNHPEVNTRIKYQLQFYDSRNQRLLATIDPENPTFTMGSPYSSITLPKDPPSTLQAYIDFNLSVRVSLHYQTYLTATGQFIPVGYYTFYSGVYLVAFTPSPQPLTTEPIIQSLSLAGIIVPPKLDFVLPSLVDSDGTAVASLKTLNHFPSPTGFDFEQVKFYITSQIYISTLVQTMADTLTATLTLADIFTKEILNTMQCEVISAKVEWTYYILTTLVCHTRTGEVMIRKPEDVSFHQMFKMDVTFTYNDPTITMSQFLASYELNDHEIDLIQEQISSSQFDPMSNSTLYPQKINSPQQQQQKQQQRQQQRFITKTIPKIALAHVQCDRNAFQYYAIHAYHILVDFPFSSLEAIHVCYQCPQRHFNEKTKVECVLDTSNFEYGTNNTSYAPGKLQCPSLFHLPYLDDDHGHSHSHGDDDDHSGPEHEVDLNEPCHTVYEYHDSHSTNPCQCLNGGMCINYLLSDPSVPASDQDLTDPYQIHPFATQCKCPTGYWGRYCQINSNCKNIPQCDGLKDHYFNSYFTPAGAEECTAAGLVNCQCPIPHGQHGHDGDGHDHPQGDGDGDEEASGDSDRHQKRNNTDYIIPTPFIEPIHAVLDRGISFDSADAWQKQQMTKPNDASIHMEPCQCQKEILELCHPENTHPVSYSYRRCVHNNHFSDPHSLVVEPVHCVCKYGWAGHRCEDPVFFMNLQMTNNQLVYGGTYDQNNDHFFQKSSVRRYFIIFLTARLRVLFNNDSLVVELYTYDPDTRTATVQVFTPDEERLREDKVTLPASLEIPPLHSSSLFSLEKHLHNPQRKKSQATVNAAAADDDDDVEFMKFVENDILSTTQQFESTQWSRPKISFTTLQTDRDRVYNLYQQHIKNLIVSAGDWSVAARAAAEVVHDPLCDSTKTIYRCPSGQPPISATRSDILHSAELSAAQREAQSLESFHNIVYPKSYFILILIVVGATIGGILVLLALFFCCRWFNRKIERYLPAVRKQVAEEASQYSIFEPEPSTSRRYQQFVSAEMSVTSAPGSDKSSTRGSRGSIDRKRDAFGTEKKRQKDLRRPSAMPMESLLSSNAQSVANSTMVTPPKPLPDGWTYHVDHNGHHWYVNSISLTSQRHHPDDDDSGMNWLGDDLPSSSSTTTTTSSTTNQSPNDDNTGNNNHNHNDDDETGEYVSPFLCEVGGHHEEENLFLKTHDDSSDQ